MTRLQTLCRCRDHIGCVQKEPGGRYSASLMAECLALLESLIKGEEQFAGYIRYTIGAEE